MFSVIARRRRNTRTVKKKTARTLRITRRTAIRHNVCITIAHPLTHERTTRSNRCILARCQRARIHKNALRGFTVCIKFANVSEPRELLIAAFCFLVHHWLLNAPTKLKTDVHVIHRSEKPFVARQFSLLSSNGP